MRPKTIDELSPADVFSDGENEWMKIDCTHTDYNAVSVDGTKITKFETVKKVDPRRIKVNVADLRPGDRVEMESSCGIAYETMTVLKVYPKNDGYAIRFARPYLHAASLGTACPNWNVGVEDFEDYYSGNKSGKCFYLVGVDTYALWESCQWMRNCDKYRLATYLQTLGDKRNLAALLCQDYCNLREKVAAIILDRIKHRENLGEFPDRNDRAEEQYQKELRNREDKNPDEIRYLNMIDNRPPLWF